MRLFLCSFVWLPFSAFFSFSLLRFSQDGGGVPPYLADVPGDPVLVTELPEGAFGRGQTQLPCTLSLLAVPLDLPPEGESHTLESETDTGPWGRNSGMEPGGSLHSLLRNLTARKRDKSCLLTSFRGVAALFSRDRLPLTAEQLF